MDQNIAEELIIKEKSGVKPLRADTYIAVIKNSQGTKTYRNLYALVDGEKKDIVKDGELSCAFFVSSILKMFDLISEGIHAGVAGTLRDLEKSGWEKIKDPRAGCIILWEPKIDESGEVHPHLGFYLGGGEAISNSSGQREPAIHHFTYGVENGLPKRAITALYWHPSLN
jgi:hypothetical protein